MDPDVEPVASSDEDLVDDGIDFFYDTVSESDDDAGTSGHGESDFHLGDYEVIEALGREQMYVLLTEKDISQLQEENVCKVSEVLSIKKEEACFLLNHYKWDSRKLYDEWFADEQGVRRSVGFLLSGSEASYPNGSEITCGICLEVYSLEMMSSTGCNHFYCHDCWQGYISAEVSSGPGCLSMRCPDRSCKVMVHQGMIKSLAKDKDKQSYARLLLRAFVDVRKKTKWCPTPGCTYAVELLGDENYDVSCSCKFSFCSSCTKEVHRPLNCDFAQRWVSKTASESETLNGMLVNCKACPRCNQQIQKENGCMYMTCPRPCGFEFCWYCLRDWKEHGGSDINCSRYESEKNKGYHDRIEAMREEAKESLERYIHYYERWTANERSRLKAEADLQKVEKEHLPHLAYVFEKPETQLSFITKAWSQIIECRQLLKWTYAYAYFVDEAKNDYFEHLQGKAEYILETLHECAERALGTFLSSNPDSNESTQPSSGEFVDFQEKLIGLTSVSREYFRNLVQAAEAGLVDVQTTSEAATSSNSTSSKKQQKTYREGEKTPREGMEDRTTCSTVRWKRAMFHSAQSGADPLRTW